MLIMGGAFAVGLTAVIVMGLALSKYIIAKNNQLIALATEQPPSTFAVIDAYRSEFEDEIKGLVTRVDAIVSLCGKDSAYFRGEIEGLRAELNAIKSAPPTRLPDVKVQPLQVAPLKFEPLRVNMVHYDRRQLKKRPPAKKPVVTK